ncbi:unnamed protein product [Dracunculus medinensis]|uniref:Equilibrative nucleoside transporter 3 n=1 Tax=Dracunculus medinensis TaxID=318479 RepID=A0A0N4UJK3_DRAME|nr:unnamed protein product [Dracunculus medinensis]
MQISAEKTSGTYKDSFNEESSPDKAEKVVKLTQPKSEKFSAGTNEPIDKNNMIFLIMLLHGVAILIPWSSFMTIAPVYYTCYKFRKFDEYGIEDTTYSHNFFSFIALASQGPNLLLNFLNLFFTFRSVSYGLGKRILVSVSIIATICCTTIIFVFIDSSNWVQEFFWITMLSIVILHSANGIFQNSLFGIAANLPHKMTTAIMIGSNLCGIYTAVLALIAITMSPSPKISATMFFSISLITILLCAVSFIYLSKSPYYLYHMKNAEKKQTSSNVESENTVALKWKVYKEIWKEGSIHFYNVFIVMFVTLAIFPAIQVHIRERAGFVIPRQYFTLIFTFLSFAFFSMIGALASKWILWVRMP